MVIAEREREGVGEIIKVTRQEVFLHRLKTSEDKVKQLKI